MGNSRRGCFSGKFQERGCFSGKFQERGCLSGKFQGRDLFGLNSMGQRCYSAWKFQVGA